MTANRSQNGWPLLANDSKTLHRWVIPARNGTFELLLRNGSAGFLLAHFALWFSEVVQDVTGHVQDDWGYALRPIRGSVTPSNHGSGTAADLNAAAHGLGLVGTFSPKQEKAIHNRLHWLRGAIRWGGDYNGRKDEMHFEVVQSLPFCERLAKRLLLTPRGLRILRANPGQRVVIKS